MAMLASSIVLPAKLCTVYENTPSAAPPGPASQMPLISNPSLFPLFTGEIVVWAALEAMALPIAVGVYLKFEKTLSPFWQVVPR